MKNILNGDVFGYLEVIERIGHSEKYICKCICGNNSEYYKSQLLTGKRKSCGCMKTYGAIKRSTTHNLSKHRLYSIYHHMRTRCTNVSYHEYHLYGGREIKICDEWLNKENGFINFYNWSMENGYEEHLTIDRINNDGNYEPSNCRWVTSKVQSNNRRSNVVYDYEGKLFNIRQLSDIYNIKYATLYARLKRGWSLYDAINFNRDE